MVVSPGRSMSPIERRFFTPARNFYYPYTRFMAIVDGFRVWLVRLDASLAEQGSDKTHKDFEADAMLEAYERGTKASIFAKDPDAPLVEPRGIARIRRPLFASAPVWASLVLFLIALTSLQLMKDEGIKGGFITFVRLESQVFDLCDQAANKPKGSYQRRQLVRKMRAVIDEQERAYDKALWFCLAPIGIVTICLSFITGGLFGRYLWSNYWASKRFCRFLRIKKLQFPDE